MTYKGAINEVKSLSQNSMMPDIFKPSLNKIAETLEMEKTVFNVDAAAGLKADTVIINEAAFTRERDAKLLTGFIDVLSREMCLNKEIAAKLADDYLNIKSLTSKEYL